MDKYIKKYYNQIALSQHPHKLINEKTLADILNKIYQDGYEDGFNDTENSHI